MKIAEFDNDAGTLIEGYGPNGVRLGGQDYPGSLLLSAAGVVPDWPPVTIDDLTAEHLAAVLTSPTLAADGPPQLVILGTGRRQRFPPVAVYAALIDQGIGVEIMDTGAACRTYNILLGEGRRVVAALLADPRG